MITTIKTERVYPRYAYAYTYKVWDGSRVIGFVSHDKGEPWRAKVPGLGGELVRDFPTRRDAVTALRHLADGHDPATVGGYFMSPPIGADPEPAPAMSATDRAYRQVAVDAERRHHTPRYR